MFNFSSKGEQSKLLKQAVCIALTTTCVCGGIVGNIIEVKATEEEKGRLLITEKSLKDLGYKDTWTPNVSNEEVNSIISAEVQQRTEDIKNAEYVLEQERKAALEIVRNNTKLANKKEKDIEIQVEKAEEQKRIEEEQKRVEEEQKREKENNNGSCGADVSNSDGDYGTSLKPSVVDPNYTGKVVKVTGCDRDILERLVMGEAGGEGYLGACLVAQCIRDTMVEDNVSTVEQVRRAYGYTGSLSREPNSDVKKAVAFIFDQGGYAVKHKIHYFYAFKWCKSSWHETQEFIIQYGGHRFFDRR